MLPKNVHTDITSSVLTFVLGYTDYANLYRVAKKGSHYQMMKNRIKSYQNL